MSRSRLLKSDPASKAPDPYALKKVTQTRTASLHSGAGSIGGSGYETERDAYLKGFESGEAAGKEQGLKEVEARFQALGELIEKLKRLEMELVENIESDVVQLSLAIAKRVIRREIGLKPELLAEMIREGVEKLGPAERFRVRLHPSDRDAIEGSTSGTLQEIRKIKSLRLESDPALRPGDCILETADKLIDGRIESQLLVLDEIIRKGFGKE